MGTLNTHVLDTVVGKPDAGWATACRRGPGNDYMLLALGDDGTIEKVEIDTAQFKGNCPTQESIRAASIENEENVENWPVLLPAIALLADSTLQVVDDLAEAGPVSHVWLDIYSDGGVSRLRLSGKLTRIDRT